MPELRQESGQESRPELKEVRNLPEKKFRAGPVSLTVWSNNGEKGSYNTVQISRSYRDNNDQWKNANSLRVNDIPKAILLLNQAFEYLSVKGPAAASSTRESAEA